MSGRAWPYLEVCKVNAIFTSSLIYIYIQERTIPQTMAVYEEEGPTTKVSEAGRLLDTFNTVHPNSSVL